MTIPLEIRKSQQKAFPCHWDHGELRLRVIVFDSNRRASSSPITAAFGLVGEEQLKAAANLAGKRPTGYGLILVIHHHIIAPTQGLMGVFLTCLDSDAILKFAMHHGATAVLHGHTHMPYVYRHEYGDAHVLWIVSCGSALYDADGKFKKQVGVASCMGLKLDDGQVKDIVLFRNTSQPQKSTTSDQT